MKKIWSLYIRFFHWSLVLLIFLSYLSSKIEWNTFHALSGYMIVILVATRAIHGFMAKDHSAFKAFVKSPREILNYLNQVKSNHHPRYLGHNPAGGFWVMVLLLGTITICLTGVLTYGVLDYLGPGTFFNQWVSDSVAIKIRSLHNLISHLFLLAILLHVLGVSMTSYFQKDNLVKSMFTGKKDTRPGDMDDFF